jgi:chromosome condensin MukBEF ATPase and DNA-binding subunit MukB|tara:strand:+ start:1886 stop:2071 length:186 start_codon:yes stop_codon:yes gene_type:complete
MKNKLTNEQKINEFIGKALQMFLSKKASKTLSNLQKSNPKIQKSLSSFEKNAQELKDLLGQ